MSAVKEFNSLGGKVVSRKELEELAKKAFDEQSFEVHKRVSAILNNYPTAKEFEFEPNSINKINKKSSLGIPVKLEVFSKQIGKDLVFFYGERKLATIRPNGLIEYETNKFPRGAKTRIRHASNKLACPEKLGAPRHDGIAKEGLDECGRLLPGYKYVFGKLTKIKPKPVQKVTPKAKNVTKLKEKVTSNPKKQPKPRMTPDDFIKSLKSSNYKDYQKRIEYLQGYLDEEKRLHDFQQKRSEALELEDYKKADLLEKEVERMFKVLDIQVSQGAKIFGINEHDFVSAVNLYSEDKTHFKKLIVSNGIGKNVKKPAPKTETKTTKLETKKPKTVKKPVKTTGYSFNSVNQLAALGSREILPLDKQIILRDIYEMIKRKDDYDLSFLQLHGFGTKKQFEKGGYFFDFKNKFILTNILNALAFQVVKNHKTKTVKKRVVKPIKLTIAQKKRYDKELASDNWKKYSKTQKLKIPLVMFHASVKSPLETIPDDAVINELGIHLGSKETARTIQRRRKNCKIRQFKVNLKNPIKINDFAKWEAFVVSRKLLEMKIISKVEFNKISKKKGNEKERFLVDLLKAKNYDGFIYENYYEGGGISCVVFDKKQISLKGKDKSIKKSALANPEPIVEEIEVIEPNPIIPIALELPTNQPEVLDQVNTNEIVEPIAKPSVKTSRLMSMTFETLPMKGKFAKLMQHPAKNLKIGISGKPKNGKTAGSLQLAEYLTQFGNVLYNFADQGFNLSTQMLWKESGLANYPESVAKPCDATTLDELEAQIATGKYQFVFIDLINDYIDREKVSPQEFKDRFVRKYDNVGFILVFESTKGGDFKGDQKWMHVVDAIANVEDFVMTMRGRYGNGEFLIWEKGLKDVNPKRYQEWLDNNTETVEPTETEEMIFSDQIEII